MPRPEPAGTHRPPEAPYASVVIPSFNRPERLAACLDALLADADDRFEIIVVDDGSAAPLELICASRGARIRCLRQENAGPAAARNAGARAARADVLAFTDDDCRPQPGWVGRLVSALSDGPMRLVGGRVDNAISGDSYACASQSLCDYLYLYFGADRGSAPFFTSNNMACRRETFVQLGGFDETFPLAAAEDRELGMRWRAAGGSLVYAPDAVVHHHHAMTLRRYWRQHRNYGRGARRLHAVMGARGCKSPKIEPARFYVGLLLHPIRTGGLAGLTRSLLLALSQVAMVVGYFSERGEPVER